MNAKVIFLFLCCCFLIISNQSFAQVADSLSQQTEEIDTVRVKKKIVLNKVVYLPELPKTDRLFLSFYGSVYGAKNYNKVCEICATYFDKVKASTTPLVSYSYGFDIAYSPRKTYFSIGASNTFYRNKFHFTDSSGTTYNDINTLHYINTNLNVGHWFRKNTGKLSYLLLAGSSFQWLAGVSGLTLKQSNPNQVVRLKDEFDFHPINITVNATARALYNISRKFFIHADLFYNYDTRSIIKTEQFVQQRNVFGFNAGILYKVK